jgi:lysine 2,3-aminomutase
MSPTSQQTTNRIIDFVDQQFTSPAPGYWPNVASELWNDQKWQLKNRVATRESLESKIKLTKEERAGVVLAGQKLAFAVTPHFFNLIDPEDPECPIRKQVIPRIEESNRAP